MKGITSISVWKCVFILTPFLLMMSPSFCLAQDGSQLEGKWEAIWKLHNGSMTSGQDSIMRGHMNFKNNGEVEVVAYGYPGCLFSNDTIQNALQWKVQRDSLIFYNPQDHFSLIYIVHETSSGEFQLKLMDDILITLKP
jgi:hypothetical protein